MKNHILALLLVVSPAFGQLTITDYPEHTGAIDSADWILMHDTSLNVYRKIGPNNLLASRQLVNGNLTSISALADPGADRIAFWDDTASDWKWLTPGTGLTITGDTIDAAAGGLSDGDKGDVVVGSSGTTLTLDPALGAQGAVLYRNASGWVTLAPSTAGYVLTTQGAAANPTWAAAAGGVSDGDKGQIVVAGTGSDWTIDPSLGAQGAVLYRNASGWTALGPGTSGQVLQTNGAAANPSWSTPSGGALTATYIGYGNGSNVLTGEAGFTYNATSNTLAVPNIDASTGTTTVGPLVTADSVPLLNERTVYGTGTAYTLTNATAAVDMSGTDPVVTINSAGTYLIQVRVLMNYSGATVAAETANVKLRRTNNTAADVTGATTTIDLPVATTLTHSYGVVTLPPIIYTTTNTDDSLTIFANVSATLGAGSIQIGEASIVALRIR